MFERNEQTLRKEEVRKRKIKKPKISMFFRKGFYGQKAKKKWSFEREDKRKTRKENRLGRKEGF